MAVVKLAKVKLVHRGQYDSSATYRAGDIVSFGKTDTSSGMQGAFNQPVPTFIYKNAEGKKGSHPYVQTRLGTVPTLGIRTDIIRFVLGGSSDNPGGDWHSMAVVGKSVVTSEYFPAGSKVLSVKEVPPDDGLYSAEIKVSKKSNNDTAVSEAAVIVGASRNSQRYNILRNDIDWDVYGDTFTFRGDWDENQTYETGNIVTRYNQAYICKHPTGAGTTFFGELAASNTNVRGSVLGPCTISKAVDPYWDYTDNWDVYMTGEPLHEKKNKILYFPRYQANPVEWQGHPFIERPRWGQNTSGEGTDISGIGSGYRGGNPWTLQVGFCTDRQQWRWQTSAQLLANSGQMSAIDGEGNLLSAGGSTEVLDGDRGGVAGNHSSSGSVGWMAQTDQHSYKEWYEEYENAAGPGFEANSRLLGSLTKPMPIQCIRNLQWRAYLYNNGIVGIAGANTDISIFGIGHNSGNSTNLVMDIPRQKFGGRSIVKLAGNSHISVGAGSIDQSALMALDEYGELWAWGYGGQGQLGIGSEPRDESPLGGNEYYNQHRAQRTPIKLHKHLRFNDKRIVDMWAVGRAFWAMDEDGMTWAWGNNDEGALGYPTNTAFDASQNIGFRDQTESQTPFNHGEMGILGFNLNNLAAIPSPVGLSTNINSGGDSGPWTKNAGGQSWNTSIHSATAFATNNAKVGIRMQADNVDSNSYYFGGFVNNPDSHDLSTGTTGWYWHASGYMRQIKNGSVSDITAGGESGIYPWTSETVCDVVMDDQGYVNYYFDYMGDGRCRQLAVRYHRSDVGLGNSDASVYIHAGIYGQGSIIRSFQYASGSNVVQKTWADYGGVQKFVNSSKQANDQQVYVLDGQGFVWTGGKANDSSLVNGANSTDPNATCGIQRKLLSEFGSGSQHGALGSGTDPHPTSPSGIGTNILGKINNIWATGHLGPNIWISALGDDGNNYLYGGGDNGQEQLGTDNSTTTDRDYVVLQRATHGQGSVYNGEGNAPLTVGYGHSLVNPLYIAGGGTMVGGNTVREAQICMTLGGEVYANGMDMHGATAAINIETTDSVNVNDNVSLHQGIDSPSPGHGWARQYAQTSHAGYMIDMCLSGGDDNTSSPTPGGVVDKQQFMYLFRDGSVSWCGDGDNYVYAVANSYRAMVTVPGYGH